MNKHFQYIITIILSLIFILAGCAPQVPKRDSIKYNLPSMPVNHGRLYIFNGTLFSSWEMDNNKYGSPGDIFVNNELVAGINRQEYIVIDLPVNTFEISWVPIMAGVDMKKRKSKPLELNVSQGMTYFLAANTRDAGSNIGLWFGAVGYLASDLLYIDTLEEVNELSKTSTRLVDYKVINMTSFEEQKGSEKQNAQEISKDTINNNQDIESKLSKLKKLFEEGLINKEEYHLKRKQILEMF